MIQIQKQRCLRKDKWTILTATGLMVIVSESSVTASERLLTDFISSQAFAEEPQKLATTDETSIYVGKVTRWRFSFGRHSGNVVAMQSCWKAARWSIYLAFPSSVFLLMQACIAGIIHIEKAITEEPHHTSSRCVQRVLYAIDLETSMRGVGVSRY